MQFGGITSKVVQAGGFELAETTYPAHLVMGRHGHEPAYLTCLLAGGYDEKVGVRQRRIDAPNILVHPQNEEHAVAFGNVGARILRVIVPRRAVRQMRDHGITAPLEDWRQTDEATWLTARMHTEFMRGDPCSKLALEGLVLELLASGFRAGASGTSKSRLQRAIDFLQAHFAESVSLEDVANAAGLHPVYMARAFRKETGMTVGDYVRRARVEKAAKLISNSDMSLAEIAFEAGFTDQAHLSRLFKQVAGITPSRYRKAYRKG